MNLLYICSGNVFRSAFAEGYTKKLAQENNIANIYVDSCGTIAQPYFIVPMSLKNIFDTLNITQKDPTRHIPKRISSKLLKNSDLILVMDFSHILVIENRFEIYRFKTFLLKEFVGIYDKPEIEDPITKPESEYIKTAYEIKFCIDKLFKNLFEIGV